MAFESTTEGVFPYSIEDVEPSLNDELLQYFHGELTGFVQVGPERYFFPYKFKKEASHYYNFEARPDDIWIATVPRSGTTWTQELIWLVANDLNFEEAKSQLLTERFPFFEFSIFVHDDIKKTLLIENANSSKKLDFIERISMPGYKTLKDWPNEKRRFIKTHFPFSLLPPSVMRERCKLIYITRNVKDVAVSYYHLNRLYRTQGYVGDFERYWNYFQLGLNAWLPYYSHLREAQVQHQQNASNVLFLNYENMLIDLRGSILKVAEFLNVKLSPDGIKKLVNHLNIKNFRENNNVNGHEMASVGILKYGEAGFVRCGGSGSDNSNRKTPNLEQLEFTNNPLLLQRANEWIAKNSLYFASSK